VPSLKVYDMSGKEIETISLSEDYFGIAPRKDIVSEAVLNELNNERRGTVKVKTRGEVSGGGKKPWAQKGTGRARAGSFQSPLWKGGAITFGPQPRDYSKKINKQTKSLAFRKVLSERLLAGDVVVLDDLKLDSPKTKGVAALLAKVAPKASVLIVAESVDNNLKLASRNLPDVQVEPADAVNVYELLRFDKIVATKGALAKLQARVAKA